MGGDLFEPVELVVATDQGDQDLAAVVADPQGQVAQAALLLQMDVHRPITGLQVGLQGCDQGIDAGIEDRAAVEVDDAVAAAAVIASPQLAIALAPFQGDRGPIAVAQGGLGGDQGVHGAVEPTDAAQGLHHELFLPMGLGTVLPMLQAAAAAAFGQDAGRSAPQGRGHEHRLEFGLEVPPLDPPHHHGNPFLRQGSRHKHHPLLPAAHPLAVVAQVSDVKFEAFADAADGRGGGGGMDHPPTLSVRNTSRQIAGFRRQARYHGYAHGAIG